LKPLITLFQSLADSDGALYLASLPSRKYTALAKPLGRPHIVISALQGKDTTGYCDVSQLIGDRLGTQFQFDRYLKCPLTLSKIGIQNRDSPPVAMKQ
jgi:hypothetical protein